MNDETHQTMTDEELVARFQKLPWDKLAQEAGELEPEKLAYVVREIENVGGDKSAQRVCVMFLGAQTKEQIEEMGKVLDTRYTLRIIHEAIKLEPSHMWKISALLIGLTHRVFLKVLTEASSKELEIIQHQALREPVQHHLSLFVHSSEEEINQLVEHAAEIRVEIGICDPKTMTTGQVLSFLEEIEKLKQGAEALIEKIGRALMIAWNTNRPDLVGKLTQVKESSLRFMKRVVGERERGTGIFEVLTLKLEQVYGGASDTNACQDDEPGVEAMTKLDLWYFSDYWTIGLLPQIKSEKALQLENKSDTAWAEVREENLELLNENLRKLGLSTVKDFKEKLILSKGILKDYIVKNKQLL
jgi:hypothetical protein